MALRSQENNAIGERFFHAAWDDYEFRAMDTLLASHALDDSTVSEHTEEGAGGFKPVSERFTAVSPRIMLTIEDAFYMGARDAYEPSVFGVPPTGRSVAFTGTTIVRTEDGNFREALGQCRRARIAPARRGSLACAAAKSVNGGVGQVFGQAGDSWATPDRHACTLAFRFVGICD